MIPIPAIDLREGRVVRLRQGDYNQQRNYDIDAVQLARRYAAEGARRLHVVDLDGSFAG
ncbi:MAG TPA: HisA/HisF-related TIM barrel protein, partial [Pseudomonadota bacterium]|nr:HisA/HisF-related TIM barrel protein [Pseudomonadota bacterium]